MTPVTARGDYFDGEFVRPSAPDGEIRRESPADRRELVGVFPYALVHVNYCVAAARAAQPKWAALPRQDRVDALERLKAVIELRSDEIARLISIEVGKPLWESRGEVQSLVAKIDFTLADADSQVEAQRPDGVAGGVEFRPLGVVAIIGPFNFPASLPHGQAVPALLAGNTVVIKPSGLTPAVGQIYAEICDAADFPRGVVNVVQGGPDVGAALAAHDEVDGVQFTGSWAAGRSILQATLDQPRKLVALEMGGKNAAVVLADADLRRAAWETVFGAYATTGQRCTATSRLVVERAVADPVLDLVADFARGIRLGHPLDPGIFMGPLVSDGALGRFLKTLARGEAEGAQALLPGGVREAGRPGAYVAPSVHVVGRRDPRSAYQREELFGPDLAVYVVEDFDEAIDVANDSDYGLVASLFSRDELHWEEFRRRARAGVLHWNRATIGASGRLPFGGLGHSGNHRPAGAFGIQSCVAPVAYLEGDETPSPPPGIPEP